MTTISKNAFMQNFANRTLDLQGLQGTAGEQLRNAVVPRETITRADLNRNGKIDNAAEWESVFRGVDSFDTDGSYNSIQVRNPRTGVTTTPGRIYDVLENLAQPQPHQVQRAGTSWDTVASGNEMLRLGSQGPAVTELQSKLTRAGFGVAETGVFGSTTEQKVKEFQRSNGLPADGVVGPNTTSKLIWSDIRNNHSVLQRGNQGPAVSELQRKLTQAGFGVQATGVFGETTEQKLKEFQRANHIQQTGQFGATTLKALDRGGSVGQVSASGPISAAGREQMARMLNEARRSSAGRRPDGYCYAHVSDYIDRVGYGNIPRGGFARNIPPSHWAEARMFAEYLNRGDRAAQLGLRKLPIDNPYNAPAGSIVVVRAGTPGTQHRTAGDIAIADGQGRFYNGGEMSYGGSANFRPGNNYVLGIYAPM
jgi:peptidoglycan hydrolase-like protein with peptidoglycan-binding domain